ncbi:MAG: hypothetical protein WC307_06450 [Candidatus Nanoarchaeia archaeon]|jgi:Zn ribbon nucleic-acid-binding protein
MSGSSDVVTCPNCGGKHFSVYTDWKPHDCVNGECLDCGYTYYTIDDELTLEEVNELRVDWGLKPLKQLRKKRITKEVDNT